MPDYKKAQNYWKDKPRRGGHMEPQLLGTEIRAFICAHTTCALATGAGDYIRNTPIEYAFHDACFWMFSEGGEKFIGLEKNNHVCIAIFDTYEGFGKLKGLQVMGEADIVEPFSDEYRAHAEFKNIPLHVLETLETPMHLIRVRPVSMDFLNSDFKKDGYDPRQHLDCDSRCL